MIVTVLNPSRLARGGTLEPADFPDVPGCLSVSWSGAALAIEFDRDLTAAEQATVIRRANSTNVNEETLREQAGNAMAANREFLTLPAPTNVQTLAQVKALTRQVNALARLALGQLDDTT